MTTSYVAAGPQVNLDLASRRLSASEARVDSELRRLDDENAAHLTKLAQYEVTKALASEAAQAGRQTYRQPWPRTLALSLSLTPSLTRTPRRSRRRPRRRGIQPIAKILASHPHSPPSPYSLAPFLFPFSP